MFVFRRGLIHAIIGFGCWKTILMMSLAPRFLILFYAFGNLPAENAADSLLESFAKGAIPKRFSKSIHDCSACSCLAFVTALQHTTRTDTLLTVQTCFPSNISFLWIHWSCSFWMRILISTWFTEKSTFGHLRSFNTHFKITVEHYRGEANLNMKFNEANKNQKNTEN